MHTIDQILVLALSAAKQAQEGGYIANLGAQAARDAGYLRIAELSQQDAADWHQSASRLLATAEKLR